jgi:hypothetical protein
LNGVISGDGRWKLLLPHETFHAVPANGGERGTMQALKMEASLFDMEKDIGETTNLAAQHPDVMKKLMMFVERGRDDLGDALVGRVGKNLRAPGRLTDGVSPLPDGVRFPAGR